MCPVASSQVPYYLGVTAPSSHHDGVISLALVHPAGAWFYAEVVDYPAAECSHQVRSEVLPKLEKIPGTRFLKHVDLACEVLRWLESQPYRLDGSAGDESQQTVQFRAGRARDAALLVTRLAQCEREQASRVRWSTRLCRIESDALQDFYEHCGGEHKVRHNALVDAVGLAICDAGRLEQLDLNQISHFELIMGTKNAMSYRAWMRRHEAARGAETSGAAASV